MRKLILLTTVLVFAVAPIVNAQIDIGAKAGLNRSNFRLQPRYGMHAGLVAEKFWFKKGDIRAELLVSQKGARYHTTIVAQQRAIPADININLLYLELPVMLKYQIFDRFSIAPGIQIGVRLARNIKLIEPDEGTAQFNGDRQFEWSVVGGLVYDFDIPLSIDARYTNSFIGYGVNQGAIQIGAAWWFKGKQ